MKHKFVRGALLAVFATGLTGAVRPLPSLSAYIGKYPSEKVAGISLYDHPKFRALVRAAAPSKMVEEVVLAPGAEQRVERQGALLVVQICELHICGDHQWSVAILSPNGPAAICYYDSTLMAEGRWFVGVSIIARNNVCWEGEQTSVPDPVFTRLAKGH